MYVEKKKVVTTGNSLSVTIKGNVSNSLDLEKGTNLLVEYHKNKIVIKKG